MSFRISAKHSSEISDAQAQFRCLSEQVASVNKIIAAEPLRKSVQTVDWKNVKIKPFYFEETHKQFVI